jgi:hypothetical protein
MASSDDACVDAAFRVCLTRPPTAEERSWFGAQLKAAGESERKQIVEDMFWSLFNSTEFSWNH